MRQLLPVPATTVDLADAYAFPSVGGWVRANMIASIDGAATIGGRSGGLGNDADRLIFAWLRQLADVILVGAGTARTERYGPEPVDPQLAAARVDRGQPPAPIMAIVSRSLDLDLEIERFREAGARLTVITCEEAPRERREIIEPYADVIVAGVERVDLGRAVGALQERGHDRISCEGGAKILAQLVAADRLDELCLTIAPTLVGGGADRLLVGPLPDPLPRVQIAHLLEDDGYLFARYLMRATSDE